MAVVHVVRIKSATRHCRAESNHSLRAFRAPPMLLHNYTCSVNPAPWRCFAPQPVPH
ncbi:hypothetical protein E2C01_088800 [Portunus trituberculatus]|uniref:Uncharacterized protein n=1 Tax=Portunus trituberculatus TaxID=210409 RepID=A0A5B7JH27_PORTR|nr:hypothetical protein [Portunus trituberculatus]